MTNEFMGRDIVMWEGARQGNRLQVTIPWQENASGGNKR
jgi:hypothetical protein